MSVSAWARSMRPAITGGQYSLVRALFGAYLFVHLAMLAPYAPELFSSAGVIPEGRDSPLLVLFPNVLALYDEPWFATAFVAFGAACTIPFALGARDRWFGLAIYYVWACLFGRDPLISNPGLPYVGWLLLMHAFVPRAPYGSWDARGRPDPRGDWVFPLGLFIATWWVMAAGYSFSGYTKLVSPSWIDGTAVSRVLANPLARPWILPDLVLMLPDFLRRGMTWFVLALELFFLPLALFRRVRPWLWATMVMMHLGLIFMIDFADLTLGMLMVHLFTFDPAWIRAAHPGRQDVVFYDGHCGLCHRSVRFLLAEDRSGAAFTFAINGGETFLTRLDEATRARVPDSVVLLTGDGRVLVRSAAFLELCGRLGGWWRVIGWIGRAIPRVLLDAAYDLVASVRRKIFATPADVCPIVPPELGRRFSP